MLVITERDERIKQFLIEVGVADTKTLSILFFPNTTMRNCQKRLKQLTDNGYIKAYRENMLSQNVYFVKKPKNIPHKIKFSQLLAELKIQNIEVLKYKCPFTIGPVIADGLIVIKKEEGIKIYFVEAERTKTLNVKKYLDLYYSRAYKEKFPVMPSILVVTDKNVPKANELHIVKCNWKLDDLKI